MTKSFKNKIYIAVCVIISIIVMVGCSILGGIAVKRLKLYNNYDFKNLINSANKVVLFIGDGMGDNQIKNTSLYYNKSISFTEFEHSGHITTFSYNILGPTDSAAAGSALATGKKYDNGEVARHKGKDIESISEYAKSLGLGVGIITTDKLYGATPASFSAHANNRGDKDEIISYQIDSNIDLFIGAGIQSYTAKKENFKSNGYTFTSDYSELDLNSNKIIGAFSEILPNNGTNVRPTLEMLTEFGIEFMEKHFPNGYFMMIEGAHIDKKSHSNDIMGMMEYLVNFDNSINFVKNKFENKNNCAIFVTADHETGGLRLATSKTQISDVLYQTGGHTSANVPYFILFKTTKRIKLEDEISDTMDNTDIYKMIRAMLTH